jgi:ribosomal RNA-processing protein 36
MSSIKRKIPPASLLQRRVKPRFEPEPESDMSDAPSEEGAGSLGGSDDEELGGGGSGSDSDEERSRRLSVQNPNY